MSRFGPLDGFIDEHWTHVEPENELSAMVVITAIQGRSVEKYGEQGHLFSLVEAGELLHAFQLTASRLDIGTRPYAGFDYDAVSALLGVWEDPEGFVLLSLGLAHPDRMSGIRGQSLMAGSWNEGRYVRRGVVLVVIRLK